VLGDVAIRPLPLVIMQRSLLVVAVAIIATTLVSAHPIRPTVNGAGSIIGISDLELETFMNYMMTFPGNVTFIPSLQFYHLILCSMSLYVFSWQW
jgi:hypothetical protein